MTGQEEGAREEGGTKLTTSMEIIGTEAKGKDKAGKQWKGMRAQETRKEGMEMKRKERRKGRKGNSSWRRRRNKGKTAEETIE